MKILEFDPSLVRNKQQSRHGCHSNALLEGILQIGSQIALARRFPDRMGCLGLDAMSKNRERIERISQSFIINLHHKKCKWAI